MKRLLPAAAILALLILPQAARGQAQLFDEDQLAKVVDIEIFVEYDAQDDCLPSPRLLEVEAELVLRRLGITVVDRESYVAHKLLIKVAGEQINTRRCAASIVAQLVRLDTLDTGTVDGVKESGFVLAYQSLLGIQSGPKPGFHHQLRNSVNDIVTELALEILKARSI